MNQYEQFRQNYTPEPLEGPYTPTKWATYDLVLLWLSGVAIGLVGAMLWL